MSSSPTTAFEAETEAGPRVETIILTSSCIVSIIVLLLLFFSYFGLKKFSRANQIQLFYFVGLMLVTVAILFSLPFNFFASQIPRSICVIQFTLYQLGITTATMWMGLLPFDMWATICFGHKKWPMRLYFYHGVVWTGVIVSFIFAADGIGPASFICWIEEPRQAVTNVYAMITACSLFGIIFAIALIVNLLQKNCELSEKAMQSRISRHLESKGLTESDINPKKGSLKAKGSGSTINRELQRHLYMVKLRIAAFVIVYLVGSLLSGYSKLKLFLAGESEVDGEVGVRYVLVAIPVVTFLVFGLDAKSIELYAHSVRCLKTSEAIDYDDPNNMRASLTPGNKKNSKRPARVTLGAGTQRTGATSNPSRPVTLASDSVINNDLSSQDIVAADLGGVELSSVATEPGSGMSS